MHLGKTAFVSRSRSFEVDARAAGWPPRPKRGTHFARVVVGVLLVPLMPTWPP